MNHLQDTAWSKCKASKRWARLQSMQIVVRSIALLAIPLVSTPSPACTLSFVDGVKANLQAAIDRSTAIVAGRATSIHIEERDAVIARLDIESVFKGQAPRVLVFRARYLEQPCTDIEPPGTEPFIAFINFDSGNIQAPDWIGFVPQSALPADLVSKLGAPTAPSKNATPLLRRLAPSSVSANAVTRTEGEISTESWLINFDQKLWHWDREPRFYVRYARAAFLLDPDYVLEKVAQWQKKGILDAVRRSLPLTESTDLYKYQLSIPEYLTELLDRLPIEATMEGRAQILLDGQCCLRTVRVNRSSLGTQSVTYYETELMRSTWKPEDHVTRD
jgi:hypothetical protein